MSETFLVYNDTTGDCVDVNEVNLVEQNGEGSRISLKTSDKSVTSPLKPREILRRITIIRYNQREIDGQNVPTRTGVISEQHEPTKSLAPGNTVPTRKK